MPKTVFYKLITDNDTYPYRIGLNTLGLNTLKYGDKALFTFTYMKDIYDQCFTGNRLVTLTLPSEIELHCIYGCGFKSDKIIIEKIMPIWEIETIQYMVSLGANIHYMIKRASQCGRLDIVQYLVSIGAHTSCDIIIGASYSGNLDVVKYLVSIGLDIFEYDYIACVLKGACTSGNLEMVQYFVSLGIKNVCVDGKNAFCSAVVNGHLHIVQYLISMGVNVNICSGIPLQLALNRGYVDMVQYLVSLGVELQPNISNIPFLNFNDIIEYGV